MKLKLTLVVTFILCSFCMYGQTNKQKKLIKESLEEGIISPREAEIMTIRMAAEHGEEKPSELQSNVSEAMSSGAMTELFEKYLEAKGYTSSSLNPQPANLTAPSELNLGAIVGDFSEILNGFLPFAIDFFAKNDVPCGICIFKWAKFGKDQYRNNPEIRALF